MKIISLGGIGGCDLAQALRNLNQTAHPYDWLITTQTFILQTFNNFDSFFIFDNAYIHVYNETFLLEKEKKAIMLHDFKNFNLEKTQVIEKYKRRFARLNDDLNSSEDILFVRIYDNLLERLLPHNWYEDILNRDYEDIAKWEEFINVLKKKYKKNIKLLIITSREEICNTQYSNIILHFTKEHKNINAISNIITEFSSKM